MTRPPVISPCPEVMPCLGRTVDGKDCPLFGRPSLNCRDYAEERARARAAYLKAGGVPLRYGKATWEEVPQGTWTSVVNDYTEHIMQRCAGPERDGMGMLLFGAMGPGKSRLMALLVGKLFDLTVRRDGFGPQSQLAAPRQAYYVFAPRLVDRIYDHLFGRDREEGDNEARLEDYRDTPLLCVDDMDRVAEYSQAGQKNKALGRLDALMEERYAAAVPTVISMNCDPETIRNVAELRRTVDRWRENMAWVSFGTESARGKKREAGA